MSDILKIARECEATLIATWDDSTDLREITFTPAQLTAFAERIRASERARLFDAIVWALGAHEADGFRESYAGDGPYWWRAELAQRAGLVWGGEKYVAALSPPSMDGAVQAATSGGER